MSISPSGRRDEANSGPLGPSQLPSSAAGLTPGFFFRVCGRQQGGLRMLPSVSLNTSDTLPADGYAGALAGRVWRPDVDGPSVVAIRADGIFDITKSFATMRDLCETADPAASL